MIRKLLLLLIIITVIYIYLKEDSPNLDTINIGSSLPKNGMVTELGNSVIKGANAYFNHVNETKLLKNKKIKFITYDDKYEPNITIDNINKLIYDDKIFALFALVGTPTVKNILPIIVDHKIPLIASFTGASFLRNQTSKYFINFRQSYKDEIESIIYYISSKKSIKRFAVFYQNDDYGEEGYIALLNELKTRKLQLVAEGTYKRNTLSISHAFNEIKDAKPDAIVMIGAYKANALFIKKAKNDLNFKDTIFCNISFGNANAMIEELHELKTNKKNLLFSQTVPYFLDTDVPVIREYQTLMQKYYPDEKLGFVSLEAFISAKILVSAMSKIKGKYTREKLIHKLNITPKHLLNPIQHIHLFWYKDNQFKAITK